MSSKNFIELQSAKEHRVYMGLGDAVLRLIHVEMMYANNTDPSDFVVKERNLIVSALNQQYQLDLGLDCDRDGIPDSIDAFVEAAKTDCCRILPEGDTSRKAKEDFPEPKLRTSRKQVQEEIEGEKKPRSGFFDFLNKK
jgi:hypothetical protein